MKVTDDGLYLNNQKIINKIYKTNEQWETYQIKSVKLSEDQSLLIEVINNEDEYQYKTKLKLKSIETVGDVVKLNVQVPMRNTYYNKKIKIKDEKINLQIARKITTHTNAGFSIKRVACKSCGGSFDGTHQRICPFCNSAYDMKEEGWVITEIMG